MLSFLVPNYDPPLPTETSGTQQLPFDYMYTHTHWFICFSFLLGFPRKRRHPSSSPAVPRLFRVSGQKLQQSDRLCATLLFHLKTESNVHRPPSPAPDGPSVSQSPNRSARFGGLTDQLTLSLTTVRDSTVSSRLGQGTADWGTMSLSSLPSPAASGSARSRALPSVPGMSPTPAPAEAGGMDPGGLEVLFEPLSPPKLSLLSVAVTGSPLPSALTPSTPTSLLEIRLPRPGRVVLRSWGCSL